ncbi:hypothetical protein, partial [Escherichia coli]|uniref:hypothetical protein n=1 Tax=Escherichia coli TaxID=562 RepID=UPI001BFC33AA
MMASRGDGPLQGTVRVTLFAFCSGASLPACGWRALRRGQWLGPHSPDRRLVLLSQSAILASFGRLGRGDESGQASSSAAPVLRALHPAGRISKTVTASWRRQSPQSKWAEGISTLM